MERDDARESDVGMERERAQRGHARGGEEQPTTAAAEAARRADVERHQREDPTDFAARGHDEERVTDRTDAGDAASER